MCFQQITYPLKHFLGVINSQPQIVKSNYLILNDLNNWNSNYGLTGYATDVRHEV